MCDIQEKIQKLVNQQQHLQQQFEQQMQQRYRSWINIPELEIPIFDGNLLQWTEFRNYSQVALDQKT